MRLIVIHKSKNSSVNGGSRLLRFAMACRPIADITFDGLSEPFCFDRNRNLMIAIPEQWQVEPSKSRKKVTYYNGDLPVNLNAIEKAKSDRWFVLSNGRFVTDIDCRLLNKMLAGSAAVSHKARENASYFYADIVAVNVEPALLSYREKVRITSDGNVAGFRRLYSDSVLPAPIPTDWPHHIFIKTDVLAKVLNNVLPLTFDDFVSRCKSNSLNLLSVRIGGNVLDLETEAGLLSFLMSNVDSSGHYSYRNNEYNCYSRNYMDSCKISSDAKLFGKIVLGQNVTVDSSAIVVGPAIIGDNVKIEQKAVIRKSVIGAGICIPKGQLVQNRVLFEQWPQRKLTSSYNNLNLRQHNSGKSAVGEENFGKGNFRIWPRFSYPRALKRIIDIIVSVIVLVLFAPLFPILALAIKLSSPGPVFFKDKRQGLHGRELYCIKFRTMILGADKIQDRLRFKSQVDGPQFKMEADPRVTVVGEFLRDTYIDEIPQFINILLGQMSVVGPRPSPKAENSLCPFWRDARLSVRPGITGLWQIHRTRQPSRDFQEWIYYDTKYIRNLSLTCDLLICWQTAKKLITNFIDQF